MPVYEIIIIDASDSTIVTEDINSKYSVSIIQSVPSVCKQRNIGISSAKGDWIFLCDDDMEVPSDYLYKLEAYVIENNVGAVSGTVLQKDGDNWVGQYPISSSLNLLWRWMFGLSIWGEIKINSELVGLKKFYSRKKNFITKAGWPVITTFDKSHFETPVYGLGASLVKTEWLKLSPFDEQLDMYGAGDNYGVALGFPSPIHVLKIAFVYHHQETLNRASLLNQYCNRIIALDYFISIGKVKGAKQSWLIWSLIGNGIAFMLRGKFKWFWKTIYLIIRLGLIGNPLLKK